MRDVMTAGGVLLVPARYAGSVMLRAAAFGWFVLAGVALLLAGHCDQRARGRTARRSCFSSDRDGSRGGYGDVYTMRADGSDQGEPDEQPRLGHRCGLAAARVSTA
jgi:hypothetical protein